MASDDPLAPLIAVPAAAMLLDRVTAAPPPDISQDVSTLKTSIRASVGRLSSCSAVVLVTCGDDDAVVCADRAGLAAYGYPDISMSIRPASALADRFAKQAGLVLVRAPELEPEPSVLALQLAAAGVTAPTIVVTLTMTGTVAARVANTLAEVVVGQHVGVCFQGDLAATLGANSPGYRVEGAEQFDARMLAAIGAGDADGVAGLGPEAAERFQARGWAPLWVLAMLSAATGQRIASSSYRAPRGVGQLVAAT